MNLDEFNAVISETRLSASNRDAARAVLVDRRARPEVENEFGLKRQRLQQILDVVKGAIEKKVGAQAVAEPGNIVEVSLALVVRAARIELGEQVNVSEANFALDRMYTGKIVSKTDFHVAQDVGRGDVVVHSLSRLAQPPVLGQTVTLEYQGGRAAVKDRAAPEVGRGR